MNFLPLFVTVLTLFEIGLTEIKYTNTIETKSGPVVGRIDKTVRKSVEYEAYTGIPFAEPPVGDLRFKAPVEIKRWTEVFNATSDAIHCLQPRKSGIIGSEDCLSLDVYVPLMNKNFPKPVMFWIHGGSFVNSRLRLSNSFRPDFLLEEDVIVVSHSYRLGALGFLNFHHKNASGNVGLKDQLLALKWVNKNIQKFGGDTNRITIFGQSAGGISVDYHVLSDLSAGLFHQAISMSGSPLNLFWGHQLKLEAQLAAFTLGNKVKSHAKKKVVRKVSRKMSRKVGTKNSSKVSRKLESVGLTGDKEELLQYLMEAPAYDIIKIASSEMPKMSFRVTTEKKFDDQSAFLTECSVHKYLSGNYSRVPYLMGFTSNEAKPFFPHQNGPITNMLKGGFGLLNKAKVLLDVPVLKGFISGASALTNKIDQAVIESTSDMLFVTGVDSKQQLMQLKNEHPIYYYRFDFDELSDPAVKGVGHEEELSYLFYILDDPVDINKPEVDTMITRFVRLITNFAKYGNPTPPEINDPLLNITWPPSGAEGLHLEISKNLHVGLRPINDRVRAFELAGAGNSPILNECKKHDKIKD